MSKSTTREQYTRALELLNPEQKRAVTSIDGPHAVLAGPGTGKTQILTLRIAHIIDTLGEDVADSILALTFTNAAVRSMTDRLASFVGYELAKRVPIFTFHSFAQHLISEHPEYFGAQAGYRIASDIERIELLEDIIENHHEYGHLKPLFDNHFYIKDILFAISKIKQEGYTPEQYQEKVDAKYQEQLQDESLYYKRDSKFGKKGEIKKAELIKLEKQKEKNHEIVSLYTHYQNKLAENKLMDYADLLLFVIHELESNKEFLADVQERYQYLLIDEHQDTNDGQNHLVELIIGNPVWEGKPNIFTVGDQKQSIFRFAGASESSFHRLQAQVPEMKQIELETNYRSSQLILDRAHELIESSDLHKDEKQLTSFFNQDGLAEIRAFSNYKFELYFIANKIKQSLDEGRDPNEIAVLYRKNYYADELRHIFSAFGIPYRDYSKQNLLDHLEMKKLFLLFAATANLQDDVALSRLLYVDFLEIHPFTVSKILQKFKNTRKTERKSIYAIISDSKILDALEINRDQKDMLIHLAHVLAEGHTKSQNEHFSTLFSYLLQESGFLPYVMSQSNSAQTLKVLEKLYDEIKREAFARDSYSLADFMSYISVLKKHNLSIEIPTEHIHGVSLLTFHGAKGLEFEDVYIYKAIETRKVPERITLALDTPKESSEDERRLLYVAMTRAKQYLSISYPRTDYQNKELSALSFLQEELSIPVVPTDEFEADSSQAISSFISHNQKTSLTLLSPEFIQERFLKRPLSVSALNNYIQSPVLYFFRNLVLLPEALNDSLEFGNAVHKVLELYFSESQKQKTLLDKEGLEKVVETVLLETPRWKKFESKIHKTVGDYYDEYHKNFVLPEEVEYGIFGVEFEIGDGKIIQLGGRIDKIERNKEGELQVIDYKTGKAFSDKKGKNKDDTQVKKDAITRQAVFYALLLENYRGGIYATRKVIFDFVEPNSKGEFEQYKVHVTDADIDKLQQEIRNMAQDILLGEFIARTYENDLIDEQYLELFSLLQK